jgi:hypothetical protein
MAELAKRLDHQWIEAPDEFTAPFSKFILEITVDAPEWLSPDCTT